MAAVIDVGNPIEVREAVLRVVNEQLGQDVARAFMGQYAETGDFTAEKYDRPPRDFDEITARVKEAGERLRARRGLT